MTHTPPPELSPARPGHWKILSLLLIPSYLAVIAVLYLIGGTATFTDPITLLVLNTVFIGLIPLYVAYISFVSFRRSGPVSVLMIGAGMLFFGLGSIATGLVGFLPNSTNLVVTIFNLCACAGAVLQLAGALTALIGAVVQPAERRPATVATAYAGVAALFAVLLLAAFLGLTPAFFTPGTGSTAVRDLVLAGAVESLLLASVLFFVLYRKQEEDFFFWYAIGLAMLSLGLLAVALIMVFDGAFNWAARFGQFIGACYILVAFMVLQRQAASGNVPVQEMLARFFGEAEASYRQLFETAADAIVVVDHAGRILLWNAAAERMFGYAADEAVGMSFTNLVPIASDPSSYAETVGAARELEARRRDGTFIPVEMTAPTRDVGGEAITTCVIRDLSERKQAATALAESEEKYRSLVDLSPDAVVVHRRGTLLYANPAAARLLRAEPGALVGTGILDLVHPDERDVAVGRIATVQDRGEATPLREFRLLIDGAVIDAEAVSGPVRWEGGPAVQVVIREISERKRAEEALRRSNEELQRFAYVASHDLQEPLRSIVSFSQLLKRRYGGKLGEDADEYIGFIVEGGNRMQALIRDLLQLSRVETNARPLVPTNTGEVVADALRLMETPIREAGATIEVGELPVILADAAQLEPVFANLVGNALKYRRPDVPCRVRISAERANGLWRFSVADNGIGIEEEYFDRIFVIFQRLHTREEYEGTGIGLAVVRKIVERHGGSIRVESVPGEGSTFVFTLPAA